jgi:hypothetical protein
VVVPRLADHLVHPGQRARVAAVRLLVDEPPLLGVLIAATREGPKAGWMWLRRSALRHRLPARTVHPTLAARIGVQLLPRTTHGGLRSPRAAAPRGIKPPQWPFGRTSYNASLDQVVRERLQVSRTSRRERISQAQPAGGSGKLSVFTVKGTPPTVAPLTTTVP